MNESVLSRDDLIVSETDEEGVITYANASFCKYAGYSLDELIGKPHNIVRHPDMPAAAFADLWKTLQSGKSWRGFVKNRAKNGSSYWVFSMVFPHTTLAGKRGYISCRIKPTSDEIKKYGELYKGMR